MTTRKVQKDATGCDERVRRDAVAPIKRGACDKAAYTCGLVAVAPFSGASLEAADPAVVAFLFLEKPESTCPGWRPPAHLTSRSGGLARSFPYPRPEDAAQAI